MSENTNKQHPSPMMLVGLLAVVSVILTVTSFALGFIPTGVTLWVAILAVVAGVVALVLSFIKRKVAGMVISGIVVAIALLNMPWAWHVWNVMREYGELLG